jgi:CMP-N-acetylneuraminic acid synthetase
MKKILCFVPARKNSQGIKNKNLVIIKKKPLIYYTIKFSKKIENSDIFLSTDSLRIKNYVKNKFKIYNDYLRPKCLSKNNSNVMDAIIHAINWFKNRNINYDTLILLQPTNPVRSINEIKKAINIFFKKKYNSLVSLIPIKEHPFDTISFNKNNWNFLVNKPKNTTTNRQSYKKKYYFIDGNFYIAKIDFLLKNKSFFHKKKTKFFVQKKFVKVDIDVPEDIRIAKVFL